MSKLQKHISTSFSRHLRELSRKEGDRDGFDDELDELRKVDQQVRMNVDEFHTASLGSSTTKNRFPEVRANEGTLVRLSPLTVNDPSLYINANYVDGKGLLGVPFVYIATQAPLPNTILDFWRMIYENGVGFIVMLCDEIENEKRKSERYWPGPGECLDLGAVWVKSLGETRALDLVYRTFLLRPPRGEEREVRHIQYCGWPDQGIPDSSASLMEAIQAMGKCERSVQCPIAVHCSGGIGRTGVFIALHVMLAQFQQERKDIDVRKTVHILKLCRTGMVQRKDQYVFLYYATQREMERMILSAEKGVNLLEMHRREQKPYNSFSFDKQSDSLMDRQPSPERQRAQPTLSYEYLQQQEARKKREAHALTNRLYDSYTRQQQQQQREHMRGASNLGYPLGFNKQEVLENYVIRTSSHNLPVAPRFPPRRGNIAGGVNGTVRVNDPNPPLEHRRANWVNQNTYRDGGALTEELLHWQERTKQMRFSSGSRGRGELHEDKEPHASQQKQQQKSRETKEDRVAGTTVKNPRGTKSKGSGSGEKNSANVVHASSPMESLVSDKKQHYPIDDEATNNNVPAFPSALSPVSIIITPQETVTQGEAKNENDVTGNDTATYSSHVNVNRELSEKIGNTTERVDVKYGSSSNKKKGVETSSPSDGAASVTKAGRTRDRSSGKSVATAALALPNPVTVNTQSTEVPLNTSNSHPITEEEFARL